ncbi:TPA_asm: coat protein [ssRNA phage Gerhypos.2_25]|jgi:hypothetical protein|uniref:Coat protein n=2 Tax=Leviviricetes TaxID=2842243 RepID=A0A8S5L187_9VIRU|nr:coat protein [ssRNA phage Gerhypos.2_25]QDH87153.1 MAG: hypothetical protein H2Bulk35362_000002 [Leviviridae sp.]QDH91307.1 MAG: hypothetical protein H1BulkLitter61154_000002 [Leviviridae sp.]DAD51409.1 TPA_asm: coat protein [ssRNA phage Gerhypos.2_25]
MAFADPISINDGTARSLARTGFSANGGTFQSADGLYTVTVSHSLGKRNRAVARLDMSKIAADPLLAGVNVKASMSAYLVLDTPVTGFTGAEILSEATALTGWLTASTNAALVKLIGGEN